MEFFVEATVGAPHPIQGVHVSTMRSLRGLFVLTVGTALPAQTPGAAPPRPAPPRLLLEDAFLASPQLPERVEVNGRIVVVADLVRAARDDGVPDGRLARHCLEQLVLLVLQDRLEQTKSWLGDAAYEAAYAAYAEPYDTTPFTVKVIATKFKGYPDLESFQRRWRVVESVRRAAPDGAFDDRALAAEAERSRDLLTGAGIEVELWFHPAAARELGQRDFGAAMQQAVATHAALAAAKDGAATLPAGVVRSHVGNDRPVQLNPLRQQLRESEYTTWLREGVAEALFRATPGELLPPMRGSDGVWVARVVRKVEGRTGRGVDLQDERVRELVRVLLVEHRFREWIDVAFARSVIRLPQDAARGGGR